MAIFYSPATGGFYDEAIHGARLIDDPADTRKAGPARRRRQIANPACIIPADAVAVSAEEHQEMMAQVGDGANIAWRSGRPVAVSQQTDDPSHAIALRRRQRDRLLAASDWTQLPDAPLDRQQVAEAAAWRRALRDMDFEVDDVPAAPSWFELPA